MNAYRFMGTVLVPAVVLWGGFLLTVGAAREGQCEVTEEDGVQVLTRGPVHEAFAEVYASEVMTGLVISTKPYEPIEELPPEQRPEGDNMSWISGYWNWDEERDDFIWVSGVWRDIPPGRQWVPGYWASVEGGWQWISGFWGEVAQSKVTYLPPPPEPVEVGPSSPAPASDHIWSPGCWIWQQTRYVWQPGYWVAPQPDWVWVPARYTWTPSGHIHVPGYWDYDIVHRGVIFAPVYYERPVYTQPSYHYSPRVVIDIGLIAASLFIRPVSRHYYFGDYYDRRYEERGFFPWHSVHVSRYGYDPLYAHYRSGQLRLDSDWDVHLESRYSYFRDHLEARPPQTLALQVNIFNSQKGDVLNRIMIGKSFSEVVQSKTSSFRFASMNMEERTQFKTRGKALHNLQIERANLEKGLKAPGKSNGAAKAFSMQLSESPVSAKATGNAKGRGTPPPTPGAPNMKAAEGKELKVKPQKSADTPKADKKPEMKSPKSESKSKKVEHKQAPGKKESKGKKNK